jgi:hypothetical protein
MSTFHAQDPASWDSIAAALAAEGGPKPRAAANPSPGGFPRAGELLSREARPATAGALPWGGIAAAMNAPGGVDLRTRASHADASPGGFNAAPRHDAPTATGALPWAVIAARVNAEAGFKARAGEEYSEAAASPLGQAETSSLSPDAARISAILYSPAAKGHERFARYLAYETAMSAEEAIAALVASAGLASASPAPAQPYRTPPAPVAASAPSPSPVVASPPSPSPASRPNTMREGAQDARRQPQLDQDYVYDRAPQRRVAYPPRDASINPFSLKIQSEYRAARAAGRPGGPGDLYYWLAEKYPAAPNSAKG